MYVIAGQVAAKSSGPAVILSFLIAAVVSVFSGQFFSYLLGFVLINIYCYQVSVTPSLEVGFPKQGRRTFTVT